MIGKLISSGIEDVAEFRMANALHPNLDTDGEMYIGTLHGTQRLFLVKQRSMDNSDGAEWVRPYQTKTVVYYLDEEAEIIEWSTYRDFPDSF